MSVNNTLNYLKAQQKEHILMFSSALTTASQYLRGGGGEAGDGFPLPRRGAIVRLDVWDGSTLKSAEGDIEIAQGERLALWAEYGTSAFDIYVRIDGMNTTLMASGLSANSTLMATVQVVLLED